jgi:hypothetical protein
MINLFSVLEFMLLDGEERWIPRSSSILKDQQVWMINLFRVLEFMLLYDEERLDTKITAYPQRSTSLDDQFV